MREIKVKDTRYRTHKTLFGKELMVLQVKVLCQEPVSYGPTVEIEEWTIWRDATLEDLTTKGEE